MSFEDWVDSCNPTKEQQLLAERGLTEPRSLACGGAGTGKTTAIAGIVAGREKRPIQLLSFTAQAAKVLGKSTGYAASTIHKCLFGLENNHTAKPSDDWDSLPVSPREQAAHSIFVVDESGMLDINLLAWVIKWVTLTEGSLVLGGDPNQLAPIGPGQPFHDLLKSSQRAGIPVTELTRNFRNDELPGLVAAAEAVLRGRVPLAGEGIAITRLTREKSVPEALLTDIAADASAGSWWSSAPVIVWTNMLRHKLNRSIQEIVNPAQPSRAEYIEMRYEGGKERIERILRVGDPVVHTENQYEFGLVNGDYGTVCEVRGENVLVQFDGWVSEYNGRNKPSTMHLDLAYAITCHKAQGGEFDLVRVCLPHGGEGCDISWLYTALTRGKQGVKLYATHSALHDTVERDRRGMRRTKLQERLGA